MKKLLLINPVGRKSGYMLSPFTKFPPIGLAYVAAVTPPDWDIRVLDENFEDFQFEEADLVGITAFTSNVNRAYEIARIYRDRNVKVVLGGIHASMATEEAMKFVDAVVVGEAEGIWGKVLLDFENDCLSPRYDGPRIDLSLFDVRPRRDLINPGYRWEPVQTSRGCPFSCSFCSVSRYLGKEYRKRNATAVLDELRTLKGDQVFFLDDNLVGYSKEDRKAAEELFAGMIEKRVDKKWWMQTSINAADDEHLLELAAKAGCLFAGIGFEAIDEGTLRAMKKGANLKIGAKRYKQVVKTFHKYGIGVIGAFIIGSDYESSTYYRELADFLVDSGIDAFQITILTPLPGTALMEDVVRQGKLACDNFPEDWDKYRMSYLVYRPDETAAETVYAGDNYIKKRLYSAPTYQRRLLRSFCHVKSLYSLYAIYRFNQALKRSWQNSHYFNKRPVLT